MALTADIDIEALLHDLFEDEHDCQQQPQSTLPQSTLLCWPLLELQAFVDPSPLNSQCMLNFRLNLITAPLYAAHPAIAGLVHIAGFLSQRQQV
jgi:hypothetical protein